MIKRKQFLVVVEIKKILLKLLLLFFQWLRFRKVQVIELNMHTCCGDYTNI